jgi:carboxypeptidase PM20D1
MKKRLLLLLTLALALLACALVINTLRFNSKQIHVDPIQPVAVDEDGAAVRLAQALRFQTISYQDAAQVKGEDFQTFHKYLEETFPKLHATLTKEAVGSYSLLYTWKGRDEKLKPILLMAHQDVVPVQQETLSKWEQPPFEGRISGGYVWGRGALDDKANLLAIMESVEMLVGEGFQPERTIYLAFGEDEEVGGGGGATKIADTLRERKVELEYVLDEGLAITEGIVPDIAKPVALIGVAEKGSVSLELSVGVEGGHSSMPPPQTAIGILSAAVNRLEERQMPASMEGPMRQMLETIGPEMPFGKRLVMANLWLFKPLVERKLSALPSTNAGIRTTTAATIIEGGVKENVLPGSARAVVNFRISPGDSIERVVAHVKEVINDPRVRVSRFGAIASEPSPVSSMSAMGFQVIQRTVRQLFPETLVAPALVLGATDSRHFVKLTNNIYRFSAMRVRPEDLERVHGVNERISVKDYAGCVRFYYQLIRNSVTNS